MFKQKRFQTKWNIGKNNKFCWHLQLSGGEDWGGLATVALSSSVLSSVFPVSPPCSCHNHHTQYFSQYAHFTLSDPHILMSSADNISAYCRAVQIFHILSLHVYYILYATRILMFVVQTKFGNISVSGLCDGSAAVSVTARKCDAVTRDAARVITNVSTGYLVCHNMSPARGGDIAALGRAPRIKSLLPSLVASPCLCLWCGASLRLDISLQTSLSD